MAVDIKRLAQMAIEKTIVAVDPLPTPPTTPAKVIITPRSLGFLTQWSRVEGADGYNIIVSDDGDVTAPLTQIKVIGENTCEHFYNTGHTAVTRFFSVQSYKGSLYSDYSAPQSATTTQSQAASNFVSSTGFTDSETTIVTVSATTTGGTLYAIGSGSFYTTSTERAVNFRLKEDGVTLRTVVCYARVSTAHGAPASVFDFSTPTAGAHIYALTAQNATDVASCTADSIGLCVMEVPLVGLAAAAAPPTITPEPLNPDTIPTGPSGFYWR